MSNLPFHQEEPEGCQLYAAKFGQGGHVACGGSGQHARAQVTRQVGTGLAYSGDDLHLNWQVSLSGACHLVVRGDQAGPLLTQMVPLQDGTNLQRFASTAAVHAVAAQPQAEQPTFAICTMDAVHICKC